MNSLQLLPLDRFPGKASDYGLPPVHDKISRCRVPRDSLLQTPPGPEGSNGSELLSAQWVTRRFSFLARRVARDVSPGAAPIRRPVSERVERSLAEHGTLYNAGLQPASPSSPYLGLRPRLLQRGLTARLIDRQFTWGLALGFTVWAFSPPDRLPVFLRFASGYYKAGLQPAALLVQSGLPACCRSCRDSGVESNPATGLLLAGQRILFR